MINDSVANASAGEQDFAGLFLSCRRRRRADEDTGGLFVLRPKEKITKKKQDYNS